MKYIVTAVVKTIGEPDDKSTTEVYVGDVTVGESPLQIAQNAVAQYNNTLRPGEGRRTIIGVSWLKVNDASKYLAGVANVAIANAEGAELEKLEDTLDEASHAAYRKSNPAPSRFSEILGSRSIPMSVVSEQVVSPVDVLLDVIEELPVQEDITDIEIPEAFIEPTPSFESPSTDFDYSGSSDNFGDF